MSSYISVAPNGSNVTNTTDNSNVSRLMFSIIMYFSVGGIALTFNICICLTIIVKKSLHEPFHYLIFNLSLSDMLLAIAVLLSGYLDYAAYRSLSWPGYSINFFCQFDIFCGIASFSASSLTLLTISIERYQFVIMQIRHRVQLEKIRIIIVGIWLLASVAAIIPTNYSRIETVYPYECNIHTIPIRALVYLGVTLIVFICILPTPIMLMCYLVIACKLYRHNSVSPTISVSIKAKNDRMKKNIIAIILISIFSAITGLPFIIMNNAVAFGDGKYQLAQTPQLSVIAGALFVLSPILNPILYNFASKKFRQIFVTMYCRGCTAKYQ